MKIHKTIFVPFDPACQDLSSCAREGILRRLDGDCHAFIASADCAEVNDVLDKLNSLNVKENPAAEKGIIDLYFLFNLIPPASDDSEALSIEKQLKKGRKTYTLILEKSHLQEFCFNIFGIFLLPSINNLDEKKKRALLRNFFFIENLKDIVFHHAFLFAAENSYIHLSPEEHTSLVETFLIFLVLSPLKKRIKKHLETMRSSAGYSWPVFFSAGIALLDTSSIAHRRYNFLRARKLLLKNIRGSAVDIYRVNDAAEKLVKEYFLDPARHDYLVNDLALKLKMDKSKVFGDSLFYMIYYFTEHINLEEIYQGFDEYLKNFVFQTATNNLMDMGFIRLALKKAIGDIEDIYSKVEYYARSERTAQLKKQYDRYLRTHFVRKIAQWFSAIVSFAKKPFFLRKKRQSEIGENFGFVRLKILKDFFHYVTENLNDYIQRIDQAISFIESEEIDLDTRDDNKETPFVFKMFSKDSAKMGSPIVYDFLFDSGRKYFTQLIGQFVADVRSSQSIPVSPDEALKHLYTLFKRYYWTKLEKSIYRIESELLVKHYGKGIESKRDLKEELLSCSTPYISFFHHMTYNPYLFYSTTTNTSGAPFDDCNNFLMDRFVTEAFSETSPWEIPIVQLEGPFRINETLIYQVLKRDKHENSSR